MSMDFSVFVKEMVKIFDRNNDGVVSQDEAPEGLFDLINDEEKYNDYFSKNNSSDTPPLTYPAPPPPVKPKEPSKPERETAPYIELQEGTYTIDDCFKDRAEYYKNDYYGFFKKTNGVATTDDDFVKFLIDRAQHQDSDIYDAIIRAAGIKNTFSSKDQRNYADTLEEAKKKLNDFFKANGGTTTDGINYEMDLITLQKVLYEKQPECYRFKDGIDSSVRYENDQTKYKDLTTPFVPGDMAKYFGMSLTYPNNTCLYANDLINFLTTGKLDSQVEEYLERFGWHDEMMDTVINPMVNAICSAAGIDRNNDDKQTIESKLAEFLKKLNCETVTNIDNGNESYQIDQNILFDYLYKNGYVQNLAPEKTDGSDTTVSNPSETRVPNTPTEPHVRITSDELLNDDYAAGLAERSNLKLNNGKLGINSFLIEQLQHYAKTQSNNIFSPLARAAGIKDTDSEAVIREKLIIYYKSLGAEASENGDYEIDFTALVKALYKDDGWFKNYIDNLISP